MRKKYLSALLFGALLFASAGTFTSCKDYDDDISNLQGQIDDVNTAITELQSAVEGGKYVTAVSNTGNTITFTFSDGTTTQIAMEDQVGSVVTVQDGVLYIDGEATEIKVAEPAPTPEPGEESKDQIIIENGMWSVLQEDGTTYKSTGIPVSGISVSGSEEEGYTLRVYNNGSEEPQIVKLPSASSSLVDIILVDSKNGYTGSAMQYQTVTLNKFEKFQYKGVTATAPQKWPGTKALPANGMYIIAQESPLLVQINPVEVDGKDVKFDLKDSRNASANLDLTVNDYSGLLTRAANSNGLYQLAIEDIALNENDSKAFMANFAYYGEDKRYAVAAGSVRSEYNVLCQEGEGTVENTYFFIFNSSYASVTPAIYLDGNEYDDNEYVANDALLKEGEWYTISADMTQIYDIFVSTDKDSETLYGIECRNENGVYQFRYTKTPDNVSKPTITIKVESVDKTGAYRTNKVTLSLSEVVADAYTYAEKAWTIVDYANDNDYIDKNSFAMKMSDMLNSFSADNLALWNTKVQNFTVQLYDVETGMWAKDSKGDYISGLPTDMHVVFVDKDNKDLVDVTGATATVASGDAAKIKATANIELRFKNTNALAAALALNHKYQVVITFNGGESESALSTTVIPFTLSIPSINDLFVQQNGVFIGGVANAYMDATATTETLDATYPFKSAFNKLPENHTTYNFTLDDKTVITDNKKSSDLAAINDNKKESTITLTGSTDGNGLQKGYKQELIVNVKNVKFAGVWNYGTADDVDYSFKIKVMSPLYEGKIVAAGDVVEIPASDLDGHAVDGSDILGYTYNNIEYSIFPDAGTKEKLDYKRIEVKEVKFESMDTNIFTSAEKAVGYTPATDKSPAKNGYVVVKPKNLAETTDSKLEVTLTDAWGYKKVVEIPVRVVVGE